MISIAICDNEITSVEDIENKVKIISNKLLFLANIDRFFTGIELIEEIKYGMKYDIIYLDIELDNENGIDVARKIREIDMNVLIIYITNYENFAKEAFEVNAFRFLNKPIDNILFERYFINAKDMLLNNNQYFYYKYNKINYKIKLNEIIYFESDKRKTYIVTSKDYKVCYIKLNTIEKNLNNKNILFFRIHQSFLINPIYINKYIYDNIELSNATMLPISEKRRKKIRALYCKYKANLITI